MKGDFTRVTFDRTRQYTAVLKQQGRVDLDADWNEQRAIDDYLRRRLSTDLIGTSGVPKNDPGFAVETRDNGSDLAIAPGRIYVDGLLVELDAPVRYSAQPHLASPPTLSQADGRQDLVYLDVWQRHVTAVEAPALREVALGGPDTTTRLQTLWQLRVRPDVGTTDCAAIPNWPPTPGAGRLTTDVVEPPPEDDLCRVNPLGGYRGLENQLYRIEIHDGGDLGVATFKWSRDNGALLYPIETIAVDGQPERLRLASLGRDRVEQLRVGDWVEVLDDAGELAEQRGTLTEITAIDEAERVVTLGSAITGLDPAGHPRLRRWDQGRDAIPVAAGPIPLEAGVQVSFSGSDFRPGDHWTFAARTATGDIERLSDAPPMGLRRHFCPVAIISWSTPDGGTTWNADLTDCRPDFPTLTEICAEDVCFDNSRCAMPEVETVQEAIDRLCETRDLRHHNRHLHGWGTVCGLQVICGPDDPDNDRRRFVTVREGYALDCEGNDILVEQDERLDILEMIRQEGRSRDEPLLDENGDGDVCLSLHLDAPAFRIEPYSPDDRDMRSMLAGTLLMDFYENCIRRLQDFFRDELDPGNNAGAGPAAERVAALTNLLAQAVNPTTGQHIYFSPREHQIMLDFYTRLRALLQSRTYCAMFDNARPFPDYPSVLDVGMDTIFGRGYHHRLRLRPNSREAFTIGPGLDPRRPATVINRYDLDARQLLSQIDPMAGVEADELDHDSGVGAVQDVAFSPDGSRIYVAIANRAEQHTIFRAGRFTRGGIQWQPAVMICDVKLVTLGTTLADPDNVYAVGMERITVSENNQERFEFRGRGLYRIVPSDVDPDMSPIVPFNAAGHLRITADGRAFATAASQDEEPTSYDRIEGVQLPGANRLFPNPLQLAQPGEDGIAVRVGGRRRREMLYVVTGDPRGGKQLAAFDIRRGQPQQLDIPLADTELRLEVLPNSDMLLVTSADGYNLQMVDMEQGAMVADYLLPMQVGPMAIAAHPDDGAVYVLNAGSNTLTVIENPQLFDPSFRFDLAALSGYRSGVINAFIDLGAGLLQYLKDCLCDHLLRECPDCDRTEEYNVLACVSIRGGQVERVCNFSRRRHVKSFPLMGYWLSLVPLVPMIDRLVEQLCCAALPELFGRYQAPTSNLSYNAAYTPRVGVGALFQGASTIRGLDLMGRFGELITRGRQAGRVGFDRARSDTRGRVTRPPRRQRTIVGQPGTVVEEKLVERGVTVNRAEYDPRLVEGVTDIFRQPPPGSEVTLFEKDGQVRYYRIREPGPTPGATPGAAPADETIRSLQARLDATESQLAARESELGELRTRLDTLAGTPTPADEVSALRDELEALRKFQRRAERFMRERGDNG